LPQVLKTKREQKEKCKQKCFYKTASVVLEISDHHTQCYFAIHENMCRCYEIF